MVWQAHLGVQREKGACGRHMLALTPVTFRPAFWEKQRGGKSGGEPWQKALQALRKGRGT